MMAMSVRKSVVLGDAEQAALAELARPSQEVEEVLAAWAADHGITVDRSSESALLRALIRVGLDSLREARLEAGYRALAGAATDTERAESRVARDRHLSRTPSR